MNDIIKYTCKYCMCVLKYNQTYCDRCSQIFESEDSYEVEEEND